MRNLGLPWARKTLAQGEKCSGCQQDGQRLEHLTDEKRMRERGLFILEKKQFREKLLLFLLTYSEDVEKAEPDSSWRCTGIRQEAMDTS